MVPAEVLLVIKSRDVLLLEQRVSRGRERRGFLRREVRDGKIMRKSVFLWNVSKKARKSSNLCPLKTWLLERRFTKQEFPVNHQFVNGILRNFVYKHANQVIYVLLKRGYSNDVLGRCFKNVAG